MQTYNTLDFGLGIHNRFQPYFNTPGASREHHNANTSDKSISSMKGASSITPFEAGANYGYSIDFANVDNPLLGFELPSRYVLHGNDLYFCQLQGSSVVKNLLHDFQLAKPTADSYGITTVGMAGPQGGGSLQYAVTWYDRSTGTESAPIESSLFLHKGTATSVTLRFDIDAFTGNSITTVARLYRRGELNNETNTDYLLVAENIDLTVDYYDEALSSTLYGTLDTRGLVETPFTDIVYLAATINTMFLVQKDSAKLWFSDPTDLWKIRSTNYLAMPTTIVGIGVISGAIVVLCKDGTSYVVQGDSVLNISKHRVYGDTSCVAHTTISKVGDTLVWLGNGGLYASKGNAHMAITKKFISEDYFPEDTTNANWEAASYKDKYYLAYYPNNILYEYDPIINKLATYDLEDVNTLFSDVQGLYGYNPTTQNIVKFFSGAPLTYKWVSGDTSKPALDILKEFNSMHVFYKGQVTILVYVDDMLINTVELPYSASKRGDMFLLNQDGCVGYSCRYELTGTGDVYVVRLNYKGIEDTRSLV